MVYISIFLYQGYDILFYCEAHYLFIGEFAILRVGTLETQP